MWWGWWVVVMVAVSLMVASGTSRRRKESWACTHWPGGFLSIVPRNFSWHDAKTGQCSLWAKDSSRSGEKVLVSLCCCGIYPGHLGPKQQSRLLPPAASLAANTQSLWGWGAGTLSFYLLSLSPNTGHKILLSSSKQQMKNKWKLNHANLLRRGHYLWVARWSLSWEAKANQAHLQEPGSWGNFQLMGNIALTSPTWRSSKELDQESLHSLKDESSQRKPQASLRA